MTRISAAAAIACGILLAGANGHPQQGLRRKPLGRKEASAVSSLELSIQLPARNMLHGESLAARVSIANRGEIAAQAPKPELGFPATFHFMPLHDDSILYSFSEVRFEMLRTPNRIVPRPVPMTTLEPGQTVAYETDLGRLMTEPVPPGHYRVKASYRAAGVTIQSSAVELTILAPQVMALAELASALGDRLITVFGQKNADGTASLMEREGEPGAPYLGATFRRATLPAGVTPASLAIAVDLGDAPRGYWFAWLEGDRIGACYGWGDGLTSVVPAVPVGLASPRLVEAGRRLSDGRAAFLVAGLEGSEVRLREFTYRYVPAASSSGPVPRKPGESAPQPNPMARNLAFDGRPLPHRILARCVPSGDDLDVELAWAVARGSETEIFTQRYAAGNAKRLYARREPLAALEMNPEGFQGAPAVIDALFGPTGVEEQRHMTFVRVPLDGTAPAMEWTFREPTRLDSANTVKFPDRWAIAPLALDHPPVLARVRNDLVCLWPSTAGAQQTVAQGDAGKAEYIRLTVLPHPGRDENRIWAEWVDPDRGFTRRPIR